MGGMDGKQSGSGWVNRGSGVVTPFEWGGREWARYIDCASLPKPCGAWVRVGQRFEAAAHLGQQCELSNGIRGLLCDILLYVIYIMYSMCVIYIMKLYNSHRHRLACRRVFIACILCLTFQANPL